jgi:hypothetical protein
MVNSASLSVVQSNVRSIYMYVLVINEQTTYMQYDYMTDILHIYMPMANIYHFDQLVTFS